MGILSTAEEERRFFIEHYDYKVIKKFAVATVFWGIIFMLVGLVLAAELAWPGVNRLLGHSLEEYTNFGRLRPLHTNIMAFGFVVNFLVGSSFYIFQRVNRTRLFSKGLAEFIFWGLQIGVLLDGFFLLNGWTQAHEYAEPEWLLDIVIAILWIAYGVELFGMIAKRKTKHIYVACWWYIALFLGVTYLHIFNNLAIPYNWHSSISVLGGVQDAMMQWWYGHNVVGFLLTVGFLGAMYYFIPKEANRPVYSYRLSVVHFWGLIFLYMWAGPHHLLYSPLPDWTQTLGMVMSLILFVPSWGGMINGIMTLQGAWNKLRDDPILKFLIVAVSFYGMSTFEGPMLSIKTVNALSHFTDWTIGHVHSGAMGWVAMITIGSLYVMIPRLWEKTRMYSVSMINWHFWIATIGTVIYITSMWVAGLMEGLMWRAVNPDGSLTYSFAESVAAIHPFYVLRFIGGAIYFIGMLLMAYNFYKTARLNPATQATTDAKVSFSQG